MFPPVFSFRVGVSWNFHARARNKIGSHFEVVLPSRKETPRKPTYSKYSYISLSAHAPFFIFSSHTFSSLSPVFFPLHSLLHLSNFPFANSKSPHLSLPILLFNSMFYLFVCLFYFSTPCFILSSILLIKTGRIRQLKLYPLPL